MSGEESENVVKIIDKESENVDPAIESYAIKLPCGQILLIPADPTAKTIEPEPEMEVYDVRRMPLRCPKLTPEEIEVNRYENYYNSYNIDWRTPSCFAEDTYEAPPVIPVKLKGQTVDGKTPCCVRKPPGEGLRYCEEHQHSIMKLIAPPDWAPSAKLEPCLPNL